MSSTGTGASGEMRVTLPQKLVQHQVADDENFNARESSEDFRQPCEVKCMDQ